LRLNAVGNLALAGSIICEGGESRRELEGLAEKKIGRGCTRKPKGFLLA